MPRKILRKTEIFPYHVCARVNNREPFPCSIQFAWETITSQLQKHSICHKIGIHALVLMPNHFHLLLTVPKGEIGYVMQCFLSSVTRIINTKTRRTGRIFGGRYFWTIIENPLYYAHVLKYIYRNPIKAGISKTVSEYPFSTYKELSSGGLSIPLVQPKLALDCYVPLTCLGYPDSKWLNSPYRNEEEDAIRRGLKRSIFIPPVNRRTRQPHPIFKL